MKNQPKRIFLDLGFDPNETISNDFNSLLSVTWSKENATGNGLEYVSIDEMYDFAAWIEGNAVGLTMEESYELFKKERK